MKAASDSRFPILDGEKPRPFPPSLRSAQGLRLESADARPARTGRIARRWRILSEKLTSGFSLVEVLAAVAIIGVITFLALPNVVRAKQDSEESLAIARAEAINLSISSFIQAHGQTAAASLWTSTTDTNRYHDLLAPYLAYAPSAFADYMPSGYGVTLPTSVLPLSKVVLTGPSGAISY